MKPCDTPFRLTLAQINATLGDIVGNTDRIIAAAHSAIDEQHSQLVIFPELAVCGYPPEDLLLRPGFLRALDQAVERICQAKLPGTILIGCPRQIDNKLYNCALVIDKGHLTHTYAKQQLPNYSVFDEKRYFYPGDRAVILDMGEHRFGLCICEDLWVDGGVTQAIKAGANAIICISASPFHLQKSQVRLATLQRQQRQEKPIPIIYANSVGGQDELIFDGGSLILNADGHVTASTALFQEDLLTVDYPSCLASAKATTPPSDEALLFNALTLGTKDYCRKNQFNTAVIGLSGGIDSALTLVIAVKALGAKNVQAILMPSRFTKNESREDAILLCENLKVSYQEINIEACFQAFLTTLEPFFVGKTPDTTEENLQARCRGMILMALSNKFNHVVLTTGNKSELAVGYSTLYGDMAGGFAVLKDLLKTQVYRLAHYCNRQTKLIPSRILTKAPSAELRENQTDQDSLPPYPLLDDIITRHVVLNESIADMIHAGLEKTVVIEVVNLIQRNEYKRRQAPPGIRVSTRAFGRDWRYPISATFDPWDFSLK